MAGTLTCRDGQVTFVRDPPPDWTVPVHSTPPSSTPSRTIASPTSRRARGGRPVRGSPAPGTSGPASAGDEWRGAVRGRQGRDERSPWETHGAVGQERGARERVQQRWLGQQGRLWESETKCELSRLLVFILNVKLVCILQRYYKKMRSGYFATLKV